MVIFTVNHLSCGGLNEIYSDMIQTMVTLRNSIRDVKNKELLS